MATAFEIVSGIIIYVLCVIGMWGVFRKAGHRGWLAIIPILNTAILFRLGWRKIWPFILEIVTGVVGIILFVVAYVMALIVLIEGSGSGRSAIALMIIGIILMVASVVITIMMIHRISKAFGHRAGFTVGIIFVPFIMYPILGLGHSEYIYKKGPAPEPEPGPEPEPEPEPAPKDREEDL